MTKKEQEYFTDVVVRGIKANGVSIGFFLKKIGFSRTHWYFIRNGERKLTDEKRKEIVKFMKERLMFSE